MSAPPSFVLKFNMAFKFQIFLHHCQIANLRIDNYKFYYLKNKLLCSSDNRHLAQKKVQFALDLIQEAPSRVHICGQDQ